jgi:hypothetical protein
MAQCQLLFVEEMSDGLILDLVPHEPMVADGEVFPAGTPLPMGVVLHDAEARQDVAATLSRWADTTGELNFEALSGPGEQRFVMMHEHEIVLLVLQND